MPTPPRTPPFDVAGIDLAAVDGVLATTRAVRRRLDLTRPVDHDTILDCIDLAEQAPTGGDLASRRWLVVRDPAIKAGLAELYRGAGRAMVERSERLAAEGRPVPAVLASAAHLAEHLDQVPVIVIPIILGRHDGSGRPGLFDSVLQAAWSFCLALRARGLGTTWTTAALGAADELAAILGLPADVTPVALLPVAWTVGTAFSPAPRPPAAEITYLDGWGSTWERDPTAAPGLAAGPGAVVEVDIAAPPAVVWDLVTDIDLPARFSPELVGAEWDPPATGPGPGATFTGRNRHEAIGEWSVRCFVDEFEQGRRFGWCTSDPDTPGARWRFDLRPAGGGTRLRYRLVLGPGPSGLTAAMDAMPDKVGRIIARRVREHRANMGTVLNGIRDLAEAAPGGT